MCRSVWAVSIGLTALLLSACSGGDGSHPPTIGNGAGPAAPAAEDGGSVENAESTSTPCTPFAKRECVIDLGISDGVHNCAKGVQICENGAWTDCAALDL